MGKGSTTTTVQDKQPWKPATPYIKQGLKDAGTLYEKGGFKVDPWQGKVVAGETPNVQEARRSMVGMTQPQSQMLEGAQNTVSGVTEAAASNQSDPTFQQGIQKAANVGTMQPFKNAVGNAMSNPTTGGFDSTVSREMGATQPQRTAQAIGTGLKQNNASQFDNAVDAATNDPYGRQLRERMRQNVRESVMPDLNATFAGSGMTGSSLHRQNLAKGLSSGMAQYEADLANRAQDRSLAAGQMAQDALNTNRGRALQAGNLALNARNTTADRRLQAAGMDQAAHQQGVQQQLQAGQMSQSNNLARRAMGLQAGEMAQNNLMDNRAMALQGAGMQPGLSEAAYRPHERQEEIGTARMNRRQAELQNRIMNYNQRQTAPIDAINNYLSLTAGLGGGFGQSMSTQQNNPGLLGMLGLGMQGAGLFGLL